MSLEIGKPAPFEVNSDLTTAGFRFGKWLQNFEYYLAATAVSDEQQKIALMLYVAGSEVQDIYKGLTVEKPDSYKDCKQALKDYFEPYTNVLYERYVFSKLFRSLKRM